MYDFYILTTKKQYRMHHVNVIQTYTTATTASEIMRNVFTKHRTNQVNVTKS